MRDIPPSGVTPAGGRRGSGHLAVPGRPRTPSRDHRALETGTSFVEDCGGPGLARSQPERFGRCGKSAKGKPRSEPDSGDPTVRDRRGARGDMAMGVGLRPTAKAVDEPPNPKARAPRIYPDVRHEGVAGTVLLFSKEVTTPAVLPAVPYRGMRPWQRGGVKPSGQRLLILRGGRSGVSRHGDCQHQGGRGPGARGMVNPGEPPQAS